MIGLYATPWNRDMDEDSSSPVVTYVDKTLKFKVSEAKTLEFMVSKSQDLDFQVTNSKTVEF